ncbi:MAG: EthD domain-containing protein [Halioglobus sp.]
MIKLVFCVRKKEGITEGQFYDYWLNTHGPLVASHATSLKVKRYVQSHTRDSELGYAISSERGMKVPGFDGIAELWWDSREDLELALQTEDGKSSGALLAEDEARFIDMENSTIFFTTEHTVFNS